MIQHDFSTFQEDPPFNRFSIGLFSLRQGDQKS